jgi:hypothetical protein
MEEYFFIPPTISKTSIKLVENTHPTTELVMSLNVNHEEDVHRALADTRASSSIILEAYTSKEDQKKGLYPFFSKKSKPSQQFIPAKAENPKKRKMSLLSMKINLTNSSDNMREYSFHYHYYK